MYPSQLLKIVKTFELSKINKNRQIDIFPERDVFDLFTGFERKLENNENKKKFYRPVLVYRIQMG